MKRSVYIKLGTIYRVVKATIRGIILLPIKIVLLPFRLLRRAVFFRRPKYNKFKRPNDTMITIIFNKLRKNSVDIKALEDRDKVLSSRINNQLEHINDNDSDIRFDFSKKIKALEDKLDYLTKWDTETRGKVRTLEDSIEGVSKDCRAVEMNVNNIKYDIKCRESGIIKDLIFNIPDEPTQVELAQIEAELAGEKVVREEYDWTHEQKTQDELIQAKMRADEAEYDRLSEPDEDDNLLW